MTYAHLLSTGAYAPGEPIDNDELVALTGIEINRDRLEGKIGIKRRHIAHLRGIDETTADFAEKASREAIERAGIDPAEIGAFVVGTDTPEYISPSTAVLIQGRIQGGQTAAVSFDVNTSCAGFVTALDVAARLVATNPTIRYAVVVGVYNMTRYIRDGDAFGYSIFADGAGAIVLDKADRPGYEHGEFVSDGTQWNYVGVYAGGTRKPITADILASGEYGLQLLQRLPGDRNVQLWPPLVRRTVENAGLGMAAVDHFIFTQINRSVIHEVMGILDRPVSHTTTVMDRYGYTGSACVPMALNDAVERGVVGEGSRIVLTASGAGLTVGASVLVI